MSRAQIVFALALAAVTLAVLVVGAYVGSSVGWGDRWYRRRPPVGGPADGPGRDGPAAPGPGSGQGSSR